MSRSSAGFAGPAVGDLAGALPSALEIANSLAEGVCPSQWPDDGTSEIERKARATGSVSQRASMSVDEVRLRTRLATRPP